MPDRRRRGRPHSGHGGPEARFGRQRVPTPPPPPTPEPESVKPLRELLEEIVAKMGIEGAKVVYYQRPEGEYLDIRGAELATVIGRHGQTLEALNHIFNAIVNGGTRKERRYFTVDAEGYRARRADVLRSLALQTLERALREKRPIALDPMPAAERKIIHLALAGNEFVATESTGVEPERRIVVKPHSGTP